jgi:hypothetical protein
MSPYTIMITVNVLSEVTVECTQIVKLFHKMYYRDFFAQTETYRIIVTSVRSRIYFKKQLEGR